MDEVLQMCHTKERCCIWFVSTDRPAKALLQFVNDVQNVEQKAYQDTGWKERQCVAWCANACIAGCDIAKANEAAALRRTCGL